MKKRSLSALWAMTLLALSAVTVYADVAPEPYPAPPPPLDTQGKVLIAAVVIIAAALIAWIILRNRDKK